MEQENIKSVNFKLGIKSLFVFLGGGWAGWLVGEFAPTFPLIIVAIVFILYDAWSAFCLDKRVHKMYPKKTQRKKAKFTSFAFGKVIKSTIPKRLALIILAYLAEKYVFVHVEIPLSYIITGVICFEQFWSILENESSCRDEKDARFWKVLQRIMVDKTERHFDLELEELKNSDYVGDEQIEALRNLLMTLEKGKKTSNKRNYACSRESGNL